MKEELLELAGSAADVVERANLARHYLQSQILLTLAESKAFLSLAFVGGTCLRFIHGLKRYSEDMDFSVEDFSEYRPENWIESLRQALTFQGFDVGVSWTKRSAVDSGWVKIPEILYELGVAGTRSQNLSIKLEVDRNPPLGAICEKTVLTEPALMSIRHYDLASLMAGKLHAVLARKYTKGRDWYDLLWYLSKQIDPNTRLLQNALDQKRSRFCSKASEWKLSVVKRLEELDWEEVVRDIQPFLEREEELRVLSGETLLSLLKGK